MGRPAGSLAKDIGLFRVTRDRRGAPLKKVVTSTLMRAWRPYRRDTLVCGHVADFQPVKEAKARRCEFCHAENFQHAGVRVGTKKPNTNKGSTND